MHKQFLLPTFLALSLALACGAGVSITPTVSGELGTIVASTLAAVTAPAAPAASQAPAPVAAGLHIVYAREGDIWLWAESSGSRQLTTSGGCTDPKISDDGRVAAFSRAGGLWAVDVDGSSERQLASPEYFGALSEPGSLARPAWFDFVPGSHLLYFNTIQEPLQDGYALYAYDLHRSDADAPAPSRLLEKDQGGDIYFSPDGRSMAISQSRQISVASPDGSGLRTVFTFPLVSTYSEWFYLPEVVWMSDSSGFYVVTPNPAWLENPGEPSRWWFISPDGIQAQLAAFESVPVWLSLPYISPDGARVAYVRSPSEQVSDLHVIDAGTTDVTVLSYSGSNFGLLGWSPDGRHLTFWQEDARSAWYAAPGEAAQPVSDAGHAEFVTWVDAETLLFMNGSELRLRRLGSPSVVIEALAEGQFDFSK